MPIIKSAIKRAKQALRRRERNIGIKKDIKVALKAFASKPSIETLSAVQSEYDTAVKKGLLKKNTVARRKKALVKLAKDAGVKVESVKKAAPKPSTKTATTKKPAAKPATKKTTTKKPVVKKSTK